MDLTHFLMSGDIHIMKKSRIILIVLAVIIFIAAVVVWWQFDNIKAVYYWWKYSESDIEQMTKKNNEELNDFIKDNPEYSVHPTTPLEEKLYQDGIINDDELADMLTEKTTVEEIFGKNIELSDDGALIDSATGEKISTEKASQLKEEQKQASKKESTKSDPKTNKPHSNGADDKKENSSQKGSASDVGASVGSSIGSTVGGNAPTANSGSKPNQGSTESSGNAMSAEISACIAKVYVLRSSFVGQLNALYSQAVSSYEALPDNQKESGKQSIISSLYPQAVALEASCDSQMEQILAELQGLLSASGGDTSLVGKIRSAYNSEKSLKKAYYLNQI